MKHKVRPFPSTPDPSGGVTGSAHLRDGQFVVTFGHFQHAIDTTEVGCDEFGEYGVIEDQEVDLGLGCRLRVETEYDEDEVRLGIDPGCCVIFEEPDADAKEAMRRAGVDPTQNNVVVPPRVFASAYFNSAGQKDSGGSFGGIRAPQVRDDEVH